MTKYPYPLNLVKSPTDRKSDELFHPGLFEAIFESSQLKKRAANLLTKNLESIQSEGISVEATFRLVVVRNKIQPLEIVAALKKIKGHRINITIDAKNKARKTIKQIKFVNLKIVHISGLHFDHSESGAQNLRVLFEKPMIYQKALL